MSTVMPSFAARVVPGESVVRTFDGDFLVTGVYVTPSGFHLLQFDGQPIRPYYATDVVYLVTSTEGGAQ
jgi:hypothetical protein